MIPIVKVGLPPKEELMPLLESCLYNSGVINEGQSVYEFEDEFIKNFKLPSSSISMSSGTSALHISLILSGVTLNDEVITTSITAEPTNQSIMYCGAKPIFADIDITSGNLCPKSVEEKITNKTKAILVVHYAGTPARLDELRTIADKYNIKLIEDCAHSLGATYKGNTIGTIGDFGIFSFQAIKHLTTIDGGFLVIKDPSLLSTAKKIRWFGMEKGVDRDLQNVDVVGYKYNFQNVFATVGLSQLNHIDNRIEKHIQNGMFFDHKFKNLTTLTSVTYEQSSYSSYWLYTCLTDTAEQSENLINHLNENGIQASKLHKMNHTHSIFENKSNLPCTENFYSRLVHIPCGWWVGENERNHILRTILNVTK